jgi:adenylate cyclase
MAARPRRRGLWWLVALLLVLVALRFDDWRPFSLARDNLFDWYQRLTPRAPNSGRVIVIDIDEASLKKLGQWPWPRTVLAEMTRRLTAAGAIVGFDILFAEADRHSPGAGPGGAPSGDAAFADAMRTGKVVLGEAEEAFGRAPAPPKTALTVENGSASKLKTLPMFHGMVQPLPELAAAAAGLGFFSVGPGDDDGVVRHLAMLASVADVVYPALALELARLSQDADKVLIVSAGSGAVDQLAIPPKLVVPTGWEGDVRPRFKITPLPTASIADLLEHAPEPGSLAGKIALVGTSAVGLRDIRMTPVGALPGVHLHAVALDNMLTGSLLWRPAWTKTAELAAMLVGGLAVMVATLAATRRRLLGVWLGFDALAVVLSQALFHLWGLLVDPTAPLIATTALVFASLALDALGRERPVATAKAR